MKRSIQTAIMFSVLSQATGLLQAAPQSRLPNNFYLLDTVGQTTLFDATTAPRAFFILVGTQTTLASKNSDVYKALKNLAPTSPELPAGFVQKMPSRGPVIFTYFDWEDKVGFKNIKDYGTLFAKGIQQLTTSYSVPCIIVSYGRAGLLVNYASQQWSNPTPIDPLPTVIQIGTPVPQPYNQYADLLPNTASIKRLFYFYSTQPIVVDQPTLHPTYTPYYGPLPGLFPYSILVLINNKQPLQQDLITPLLTQNILSYCNSAQKNYVKNKNLFIHLSGRKLTTNGIIAIATSTRDSSTQALQEKQLSDTIIANFTAAWGRSPELEVSEGEALRNRYKFQRIAAQ